MFEGNREKQEEEEESTRTREKTMKNVHVKSIILIKNNSLPLEADEKKKSDRENNEKL